MMVLVEHQSLIGSANCVNGGTAPPPKSLVRIVVQLFTLHMLSNVYNVLRTCGYNKNHCLCVVAKNRMSIEKQTAQSDIQ